MKNLLVLFTTILVLESSCPTNFGQPKAHELLQRSCQYLWGQQSANGGWHSKTYNKLRGGASLTAFLVYTLLQVPDWIYERDEKQVKKAVQFIRRQTNSKGVVGCNDSSILDRPNYATAYALMVLQDIGAKEDSVLIRKMTRYLKQQQLTEQHGFNPQQYPYGSWGFGGSSPSKKNLKFVDLAHTQLALMALQGSADFDHVVEKSSYFFRLLQKSRNETRLHPTGIPTKEVPYDGGFFESPVNLGLNKAGIQTDDSSVPYYFRSYSTATCEGILGLCNSGKALESPAIKDALNWLYRHPSWTQHKVNTFDDPMQWQEALFYYDLALRSEVFAILEVDLEWQGNTTHLLEKEQRSDGSFQNEAIGIGFENDPLVATGLAISSLCWALD